MITSFATPSEMTADIDTSNRLNPVRIIWQIGAILALWPLIKAIPGLPYAGQVYMFFSVLLATWFLRRDGETWRDLGLRWAERRGGVLKGAGMVVAIFALSIMMNAFVQFALLPALGLPVERTLPDVSTLTLYLIMIGIIWTTNAFGEEMVFRGFLMSRFSTLFGGTRFAWILAAFAQSVIFGLGHAYQGTAGIVVTGFVGLVFGLSYLLSKRNLWPVIIAHGLINTIGMTVLHLQATGAMGTPVS
ncbi:MAG: type II CAAX endopeptidase family protein [Pseudomonadota bacterium]